MGDEFENKVGFNRSTAVETGGINESLGYTFCFVLLTNKNQVLCV